MRFLLMCVFALSLTQCKSDPYEGRPEAVDPKLAPVTPASTPTPTPTATPTPTPTPTPQPHWSLEAPDIMYFKEEVEGTYTIRGVVEPPGQAVFQFKDMPKDMQYDATTGLVTWTPSNAEAPGKGQKKVFVIQVQMLSTTSPNSVVLKNVVVIVEDAQG